MEQQQLRLLLVGDEGEQRWTPEALRAMRWPGPAVYRCVSLAQARAALGKERFDLWLVDSPIDGTVLELLHLARESESAPPVIVLTSARDREADRLAMEAGAADVLVKGQITPDLLEQALGHALARERTERARRRVEEARADVLWEQVKRTTAEATQRRLSFLAEASAALAASLELPEIVRAITRLAVPFLANYAAAHVRTVGGKLEGASALLVGARERREWTRHLERPAAAPALEHVLRSGEREQVEAPTREWLATVVADAAERAALLPHLPAIGLLVPLLARGQPRGVLTLIGMAERFAPRRLDPPLLDHLLIEELARRAAVAVDNANLYAEARAAVRARDEFLSVAAHELRTPVTAVRGFAQLAIRQLERRGQLDPQRAHLVLTELEGQTAKLTRLVGQLLDISRLEAGKLVLDRAPADLSAIVHGAIRSARAWGTPHPITLEAPPSVRAKVDALRLEQVLTNLLDNAIKFSPAGGAVNVTVAYRSAGQVAISVRDYGIGVPPEARERIFARFSQVERGGHLWGLGLGLYISRQIVELHGGHLDDVPTEGPGAAFVLTLPTDSSPPTGDLGRTGESAPRKQERVKDGPPKEEPAKGEAASPVASVSGDEPRRGDHASHR